MGISFRKSFRIGKNTRINFSKNGGIGISTGVKGFRVSKNNSGVRFTLGGNGIHYTKWFTKKKKTKKSDRKKIDKNLNKLEKDKLEEIEKEERIINPETDFERIPTEDEQALLLYLGSRERNYLLYLLLITLLGLGIFGVIQRSFLSYILIAFNICLLLLYLLKSKLHSYVYSLNHSITLFQKNRLNKAYKLLKKCLAIKPKSDKALIMMMFTAFRLEKYEEALYYVEAYKEENSPLEVMYFIEGCASTELGKYQEGIAAIEKIYSEDDDIRFSKYKVLGDCYLGLNDYDKAISWYKELPVNKEEMDEDQLEYKYALGKALFLKGHKKRAFSYLSKVYDYRVDYKDVKALMDEI
ncbi:DUF4236 domain-containing protein [Mycoplasmatota bacterium]|nr:DUF4236 domain-containing protein [Mycoplasmatota bacterium]